MPATIVEYQYTEADGVTYSGEWLTLAELQAVTPTGAQAQKIKVRVTGEPGAGLQMFAIGRARTGGPVYPPNPTTPDAPSSPFVNVWADNLMHEGAAVFWEIVKGTDLASAEYKIEFSRTTNGTWTEITESPITDAFYAIDGARRLSGKEIDLYYRVTLFNGVEAFQSLPVRADGGMPRRDWLRAREIVRKEYLHMVKGPNGLCGRLLKRRNWGTPCPNCLDHDTGESREPNCPVCFGTAIEGGYYPAVMFWVLPQPSTHRATRAGTAGHATSEDLQVRCLAYPMPTAGDIWCSDSDGRRYIIGEGSHTVQEVSCVRDKPLVLSMVMGLAPASHNAYAVQLDGKIANCTYRLDAPAECAEDQGDLEPVGSPSETWSPAYVPDY